MKVAWSSCPRLHSVVHRKAGASKFDLCNELRAPKLAAVQALAQAKSASENIPVRKAVVQLMKISTAELFPGGLLSDTEVHKSIVWPVKNISEAQNICKLYTARLRVTAKLIIDFMYGTNANPTKRTQER